MAVCNHMACPGNFLSGFWATHRVWVSQLGQARQELLLICSKQNQNLTIDHSIPLAKGGSDDLSNLQTLCLACNSRKQHHWDERFRRRYW